MRLYADRPVARVRQIVADLLAVLVAVVGVLAALWTHDQVSKLAEPGRRLEAAGNSLSDNLGSAGDKASKVPVVGKQLRDPLEEAGEAANGVADAGQSFQDTIADFAVAVAVFVALFPLLWLLVWLFLRARWIRRAAAARRIASQGVDASLFALRALSHQPLERLGRLSKKIAAAGGPPDLMAAWRAGDPAVVAALADLELSTLGMRQPRPPG